ncbi:MAG: ABC transporter substrate-binding protein [Bacteroidetes bacterium]|nr:ABC transporter substrate-binding protein [Bacteroidota bacterium]
MKYCSIVFLLLFISCGTDKKVEQQEEVLFSASKSFPDTSAADPSWSKENTLVYHTISEPDNLHPTNGSSAPRGEINLYLHMGLVAIDLKSQEIAPSLLKSLPAVDSSGLVYTYELRDEPKWDDGSSLSMEDIVFFFKAVRCPLTNNPFVKSYFENLKEVRPDETDPKKFILVMKRPYIQNAFFLSDIPMLQRAFFDPKNILSKYSLSDFDNTDFKPDQHADLVAWAAEFNNEKYGRDPASINGIGAYKVEKWDQGQSVVLVKKKNHWTDHSSRPAERSYPERIIFRINKDDNSTMLEFKTQTLDASCLLSAKNLMNLKKSPDFNRNYNSTFIPTYHYTYLAMNEKPDGVKRKKIFDDARVRKAMAYLTPVDQIIKLVYGEYSNSCKRMTTNVSPLKKEHDPSLPSIPLDIDKASALLEESGWKDSNGDGIRDKMIDNRLMDLSFDLNFLATAGDWKDMATITAEQMLKAGVKATPVPLDVKVFIEKARTHDFDMIMGSWSGSCLPEDYTQLWHSGSWSSGGSNYSGFGNPSSDALIDSIKVTLDEKVRTPMVMRLQKMIFDDQPFIFIYTNLRRAILHKRFGNCEFYSERPGILLSHSKLIGAMNKDDFSPH